MHALILAVTSWVWLQAHTKDVQMSGSVADLKAARAQRQKDEPLLYVRREGHAWVIRDNQLLAAIPAIFKEPDALSRKIDVLANRMDALDKKLAAATTDKERDDLAKKIEVITLQMDAIHREVDKRQEAAESKLLALIEDAIKTGKAGEVKPVPRGGTVR